MAQSTLSDSEIERLLSGTTPESEAAQLVALMEMIRAEGDRFPSESAVAVVASQAASLARSTPMAGASTRLRGPTAGGKLRPQVAVVAGAIVVFGFSGAAAAADSAVPGDVLYGIDRALEKIGIGAGHAEERLDEARTLLSKGETGEALRHVTEVLTEEEDGSEVGEARDAVEDAAVTLEDDGQASNTPAKDDVAVLIDYLRANLGNDVGADGKEFGQDVADLARDIGPGGDGGPPSSNPGEGNGNGMTSPKAVGPKAAATETAIVGSTGRDQTPGNSGKAPGRGADF